MTHGNRIKYWTASTLLCALAACSSGSGDGITVVSAVQDLTLDPDGLTTRIVFSEDPGSIGGSNFTASGGQSPVSVSKSSNVVQIVWDARVTRSHTVRVISTERVSDTPSAVSASDTTVPTFAITSAVQDVSDAALGGDTMTVTFSGPRVVASEVVDSANWALTVDSAVLDWTGSMFNFSEATQVLTITLGPAANLHTNLSLAALSLSSVADIPLATTGVNGTAAGDAVALGAPTIEQQLAVDPLGRVVDFTFPKPMDPVGGIKPAKFTVNDHGDSSTITLPLSVTQTSATTLRVTFSAPVVPGLDTVTLNAITGYHGNAFTGTMAFVNSAPAANDYTTVTAETVENAGGDSVVIVTDQALDPDLAVLPARWTMTVDGNPVTMADQTLTYDLSTRTLTIELDFDMDNGDAVVVTAVGQKDVDGEDFSGSPIFGVTAAGDATEPSLVSALQNRTVDPTGQTVDVTFSEDMDPTMATNTANFAFSPAVVLNSSALVGGSGRVVRIAAAEPIVPSDYTFSVVGAVEDLAGQALNLGATMPVAVSSTDMTDPAILAISSSAPEGADNDTVVVLFNDKMVESEVETPANWTVESPAGTPIDVSGCTIDYTGDSATLTLDSGGIALKGTDSVEVTLGTMRDVGGRAITMTPGAGIVVGEANRPTAHTVWRDSASTNELVVYFSEPCDELQDLFDAGTNPTGSRFAVRDDDVPMTLRGYPLSGTVLDGGLGVRLTYGFLIDLDDTLDVFGVTDLAGNYMFPVSLMDIIDEVPAAPTQNGGGFVTAFEGEDNDRVLVSFAEDMSPWKLLDPAQYAIAVTGGGAALSLSGSMVEVIATNPTQIRFTLDSSVGANVQYLEDYDLTLNVDPANPLRTAQGVPITVPDTAMITAGGDLREPLEGLSSAITDPMDGSALYVVFNEAVEVASVSTATDYVFNGGAATGTAVTSVSPRVVHVAFDNPVSAGSNLVIAAGSEDLAGTATPAFMTLAVTDDVASPLLSSVTPTAVEGLGGDTVRVEFNEVVDLTTALDSSNYSMTNGGVSLNLSAAVLSWSSFDTSVTIQLPSNIDLDPALPFTLGVDGVQDVVGNTLSGANLGVAIAGDMVAPTLANAFVNLREDPTGAVVDVLFSEDVEATFAVDEANWTVSGGQTVMAVVLVSAKHYRLTLDMPLGGSDTVDITGVADTAGNLAGALSFDPIN